jgi:hypothetical protein
MGREACHGSLAMSSYAGEWLQSERGRRYFSLHRRKTGTKKIPSSQKKTPVILMQIRISTAERLRRVSAGCGTLTGIPIFIGMTNFHGHWPCQFVT